VRSTSQASATRGTHKELDAKVFFQLHVTGNVSAGIGAIRAEAPHFGHVEHLAQHAERVIRVGRLVCQLLHQPGNVGALHILNLLAAQQRDDVAVDDGLIAFLRARLVAFLGVVLHELLAQRFDRGRFACLGLGTAGVAASTNFGQPVLRHDAGLLHGQFAEQPQGGLTALPGVRPVLEHEHLAARRGNLAQEARHHGIP
jgi:hypothetical protein